MSVYLCFLLGGGAGVNEDKDNHSPFLSLPPSLSFPGGLYGWKWGVLSATSLAQTVPSALSEDQPERGEADNHRHCGSVPRRKAAHSAGIPHGELHCALQFCVYPRCGGSRRRLSVAALCSVFVSCSFFRTWCAVLFQIVVENLCSLLTLCLVVSADPRL